MLSIYSKIGFALFLLVENISLTCAIVIRFSEIDFGKIPRQTAEDVVLMMIDEGKVLRINEEMFTMKHLMDEAKEKIQNHLKEEHTVPES